jgi:hypothetical protein
MDPKPDVHELLRVLGHFEADPLCSLQGPLGAKRSSPLPSRLCKTREGRAPPLSRFFLMIIFDLFY